MSENIRMEKSVMLSIAGSDSGGNAGIQADIKAAEACGVFAATAITAITAQNPAGVARFQAVAPDLLRAQIDAVFSHYKPRAIKSGMLPDRACIAELTRFFRDNPPLRARLEIPGAGKSANADGFYYVLDPVMIATSGDKLINDDAIETLARELIPLCSVFTPNIPEAEKLLRVYGAPDDAGLRHIRSREDMELAAQLLCELSGASVLLKGGHLERNFLCDIFFDGAQSHATEKPAIRRVNTHGSGCGYSAALAAMLARGENARDALELARDYIHGAFTQAVRLGSAADLHLNHFA